MVRRGVGDLLSRPTNALPFSPGAKWNSVGTVAKHEWSQTGDVVQTNLLPIQLFDQGTHPAFAFVAAENNDVTVTFTADGGLQNASYIR